MKAIMFSGQGAQKIGMGKEFYDNFDICRKTFDEASEALGLDISRICFEENDMLNQTIYAQPALLTVSICAYRLLREKAFMPDILMGLSLGEYSALTASGAIEFADAVRLVHRRGQIMTELAKPGGMVASVRLSKETLEEICLNSQNQGLGFVACANFNTYDQIVLAGEKAALDFCMSEIKKAGGRAIPLQVSGPFHTKLLDKAAEKFREELLKLNVSEPKMPIISNLTADKFNIEDYAEHLTQHMISPVRWVESVEKAVSMGVYKFIELGSGKTLMGFVKKIDDTVDCFAVESIGDLEGIL